MQTQFTTAGNTTAGNTTGGNTTAGNTIGTSGQVSTIVDYWAGVQAGFPALEFVADDGTKVSLSYEELRQRSLAAAVRIGACCAAGDRVVLMFSPGLEFVVGFMGCLYAGVLAVPALEPKPRRLNNRLARLVADCHPAAVVTDRSIASRIQSSEVCPSLADVPWIVIDETESGGGQQEGLSRCVSLVETADVRLPAAASQAVPAAEQIAFLQYTSGSTSDPLGVMVTHGNLLHNLEMIRLGFGLEFNRGHDRDLKGVFWLPPYHDMGLIGGILTPLYIGGTSVLMSPAAFMKRPLDWLQLIAREQARISGAPNFAYDLCAQRAAGESLAGLDLSSWKTAFCGAEPIRAETFDRFCEVFQAYGFRRQAFYPCYGLAEATLLVTGSQARREPVVRWFDRQALERKRLVVAPAPDRSGGEAGEHAVQLVSCGQPYLDGKVLIVNPRSRTVAAEDEVGEIWYRGGNVAAGYWNAAEKTAEVFQAQLADASLARSVGESSGEDGGGAFLRTGDTGFVLDGQLFITGRAKEMLVIRGRNLYPQDIEATVRAAAPGQISGAAAFAMAADSAGEGLAVAFEIERHVSRDGYQRLLQAVRQQVVAAHEVAPQLIVAVRMFGLPRTTSGKMQRLLTKHLYRKRQLPVLAQWPAAPLASAPVPATSATTSTSTATSTATSAATSIGPATSTPLAGGEREMAAGQIEQWLCQRLANYGNLATEEVSPDSPLADFGLDSMAAMQLVGEIEERYRIELNPIAMWNYPTARHLADYLALQVAGPAAAEAVAAGLPDVVGNRYESILSEIERMDEAEVLRRLESM